MKTITPRGVDPSLADILKQNAREKGTSVNQLILDSLKIRFGLEKEKKFKVHRDMDHLFGKWSEEEFEAIQKSIDSGRVIDLELGNNICGFSPLPGPLLAGERGKFYAEASASETIAWASSCIRFK